MRDLPTITDSSHSHSVYTLGNLATPLTAYAGTSGPDPAIWQKMINATAPQARRMIVGDPVHNDEVAAFHKAASAMAKVKEPAVTRRLVQVFIADPDENVPLDRALLYSGSQKFTDATDQELFFEIDIKSILDNYNDERVKLVNKKVKERTEYLEPVKIRDLKMTVVNIATF